MVRCLIEVFIFPLFHLFSFSIYCRVVYLLQMHPMDISARLLSPILTAQTWVSKTFHPQQKPGHQALFILVRFHFNMAF